MLAQQDILWIFNFLSLWIILFLIWQPVANASEVPIPEMDPQGFPGMGNGCLANGKYHAGIEPIRAHNSGMAVEIYRKGNILGDPNGCVVCHAEIPAMSWEKVHRKSFHYEEMKRLLPSGKSFHDESEESSQTDKE